MYAAAGARRRAGTRRCVDPSGSIFFAAFRPRRLAIFRSTNAGLLSVCLFARVAHVPPCYDRAPDADDDAAVMPQRVNVATRGREAPRYPL